MTFYLYNDIHSWTAESISSQIEQIDEIEINSSGGDVFSALAIVDTLKNSPRAITIRVRGLCASAATLLLCTGKKVIAAQNSLFLLHAPSTMVYDRVDAAKLKEMATTLEKIEGQLKAIYSTRVKDIDLSQEKWLTADEALAMGLIDEIDGRVEVTAQNGLLFVNKCVFQSVVSKPQAAEVKDVASEILAVIKDQLSSGAAGVGGSVPPQDETERKINLVASYANGGIR